MKLRNLDQKETEIVRKCMECIADGKVILHDFEFHVVMGVTVEEFIEIYNSWPEINENDNVVSTAINNSMNNLLGYPHGKHHRWEEFIDVPLDKIAKVFNKWCDSSVDSYFNGIK